MNEKDYNEDELPEPEGFWPDTHPAYEEPYELVPFTPDSPEFVHPPEPPEYMDEPARPDPVPAAAPQPEPPPPSPVVEQQRYEPVRSEAEQTYDETEFLTQTRLDQWQDEPAPAVDPFSADPFSAKVTDEVWTPMPPPADAYEPQYYVPESTEENVRRSGLAWSAGIAFFGSVAFMLFLGWIADVLLGTGPWGMVGGIVFGSVIGFIQFFRISSQIYGKSDKKSDFSPFLTRTDDPTGEENEGGPETTPPAPPLI
jgi:F0F1-type ATP synthase assembly protein I